MTKYMVNAIERNARGSPKRGWNQRTMETDGPEQQPATVPDAQPPVPGALQATPISPVRAPTSMPRSARIALTLEIYTISEISRCKSFSASTYINIGLAAFRRACGTGKSLALARDARRRSHLAKRKQSVDRRGRCRWMEETHRSQSSQRNDDTGRREGEHVVDVVER